MDFEKNWRKKLKKGFAKTDDPKKGLAVLQKIDRDPLVWTRVLMEEAAKHFDDSEIKEALTECSCRYPSANLQELKRLYELTQNLDVIHGLLQNKFEKEIKISKKLNQEELDYIRSNDMGLAGVRNGRGIVATKVPADVHAYLAAEDPIEKATAYCHCPRIRNVFKERETLDYRYCYCGAGYYKDLWETLLQKPVEVEILQSLLKGDPVCSFHIEL